MSIIKKTPKHIKENIGIYFNITKDQSVTPLEIFKAAFFCGAKMGTIKNIHESMINFIENVKKYPNIKHRPVVIKINDIEYDLDFDDLKKLLPN